MLVRILSILHTEFHSTSPVDILRETARKERLVREETHHLDEHLYVDLEQLSES